MSNNKRDKYCNNSLKYVGVKFGHQGRNFEKIEILTEEDKKKIKLDCAGLCVESARITGILMEEDDLKETVNYPHIPDGSSLINHLNKICDLKKKEELQKGDIIVMAFNGQPTHLAIFLGEHNGVGNGNYFIHSYIIERKVVIQRYDSVWESKVVAVYSIKNIDD